MSCLFYLPIMSFYFCVLARPARLRPPELGFLTGISPQLRTLLFQTQASVEPSFQLLPSFNPQLWPDAPNPPPPPPPSFLLLICVTRKWPHQSRLNGEEARVKNTSLLLHTITQSTGTSDTPDARPSGASRRSRSPDLLEDIIPALVNN